MTEQHIHRFAPAVIPLFENCEFCGERILCTVFLFRDHTLAAFNPAYQCSLCLKYCHKQCCETADSISPCTGKPESTVNQEQLFTLFPVNRPIGESTIHFYDTMVKAPFLKKEDNDESPSEEHISLRSNRYLNKHVSDSDSMTSESVSSKSGLAGSIPTTDETNEIDLSTVAFKAPYTSAQHRNSFQVDDDILSSPGFLTVIIQQATDLDVPAVLLSSPPHP